MQFLFCDQLYDYFDHFTVSFIFQLTFLFVIVLWTCVDCSPSAEQSQELTDREMEMKQLFQDRAEVMAATDRDMHNWWAEYDILMANYRAMFADNVCHNPDMLNASLLIIEAKIEKVTFDIHK